MAHTDCGAAPGATGPLQANGEHLLYLVAPFDTASAIAARFSRRPRRLLDANGELVQVHADTDVRPLVDGLRLTDPGFAETLDAGAGAGVLGETSARRTPKSRCRPRIRASPPGSPILLRGPGARFRAVALGRGLARWWGSSGTGVRSTTRTPCAPGRRIWTWDDGTAFDQSGLLETEDIDPAILGIAFLLMRVTGRIDARGRDRLTAALRRQQERFGDDVPDFARMLADLGRFVSETDSVDAVEKLRARSS